MTFEDKLASAERATLFDDLPKWYIRYLIIKAKILSKLYHHKSIRLKEKKCKRKISKMKYAIGNIADYVLCAACKITKSKKIMRILVYKLRPWYLQLK